MPLKDTKCWIHRTRAAASLQPLSIKVQLVTPKPAFEQALHQLIPESERLHSNRQSFVCVLEHVSPTGAAEQPPSFLPLCNLNKTFWLIAWNQAAIIDLQQSQSFFFCVAQRKLKYCTDAESYSIYCFVPTGYKHECSVTFFLFQSQAAENLSRFSLSFFLFFPSARHHHLETLILWFMKAPYRISPNTKEQTAEET